MFSEIIIKKKTNKIRFYSNDQYRSRLSISGRYHTDDYDSRSKRRNRLHKHRSSQRIGLNLFCMCHTKCVVVIFFFGRISLNYIITIFIAIKLRNAAGIGCLDDDEEHTNTHIKLSMCMVNYWFFWRKDSPFSLQINWKISHVTWFLHCFFFSFLFELEYVRFLLD